MRGKPRDISHGQLVMLLFLSRMFSLFTYAPRAGAAVPGQTALLSVPLGMLLTVLAALPFLLLYKKGRADLLTCVSRVSNGLGKVVALLCSLFCIVLAAYSAGRFQFLMVSTVYQNARPEMFALLLLAVAAYAAGLGLESFARMAGFVFALVIAVCGLFLYALAGEADLTRLSSPLYDGIAPVIAGAVRAFLDHAELLLFVLLLPRVREAKGGRVLAGWAALATACYELLAVLVLTVLGDYAKTRLFPLQALSATAQLSVFGRLDLVHIALWIFLAFLRASLWIFCAGACLRRVFPRLKNGHGAALCMAAAAAAALLAGGDPRFWEGLGFWTVSGLPLLALAVALPLLTLCFPAARRAKKVKKEDPAS